MARLLATKLDLRRCPHCNVDTPNLGFVHQLNVPNLNGNQRFWRLYTCGRCGGLVSATADNWDFEVTQSFPASTEVSADIPDRARAYLEQALSSLSVPAGAVMLAASAVDAMLKARGLSEGSLYSRIDAAAANHLITTEMAQWAHEVRLDANDQRHADHEAALPDPAQAQKCVDFAVALAQFMFVLPARVKRGIESAKS
jgi:hypothetical protein